MRVLDIDKINLGLIMVSFVLACVLPFELFLFGYAVLGPLHYLTETNWIIDKNYFVSNKLWKYIVIIAALLFSIPYFFRLGVIQNVVEGGQLYDWSQQLGQYTNIAVFLTLVLSIVFLFNKSYKGLFMGLVLTIIISIFGHKNNTFNLINGLFLPTIIHVYLFTILFMIYGARKEGGKISMLNIILMLVLPLLLVVIDIDFIKYHFSDGIKNAYMENKFHYLNAYLAQFFGVYKDLKFFFYEKVDLKIQIFIAFAYIYHYLNWFSKTTVIGWHKKLTTKKSIGIVALWSVFLMVYWYDYRAGVIVTIFFSIIHVMFELPLNMITIKELFALKK